MVKFKKLAMLCAALIATASMATGCSVLDGILSGLNSSSEASSVAESTVDSTVSEEESSKEESSEEESSSDVVDDTETGYYKLIVDGAAASLTAEAMGYIWGELTFNAPTAGTYGIYAVDSYFNEAGVEFGAQGETNTENCSITYLFDVLEAGDVTLATNYFFWGAETLNFNYYIYKLNKLEITELEGTAELCANLPVPVSVTAPAAGKYVLRSTTEIIWANDMEDLAAGGESASKKEFEFSEAGEKVDFLVKYNDFNAEDFAFEWTLAEKVVPALNAGENNVTLLAGSNEFTFTAETSATYEMTILADLAADITTNDTWSSSFIFSAEAGVPVDLAVYFYGWDEDYVNYYPTTSAIIMISAFEMDDPSALVVGDNIFTATEEGVVATFTAPSAGTYEISDNGNFDMWFEDTVLDDWGDADGYKEVTLEAGESISFTVKYDGVITITITKLPDNLYISIGDNTLNVPTEMAYLNFTDVADESLCVLTFDGSLVAITEDRGWMVMEIYSETEFTYSEYYSYTIVSKSEDAVVDFAISLTATAPIIDDGGNEDDGDTPSEDAYVLVLGENAVAVPQEYAIEGIECVFTASSAGTYTFTPAEDETNAYIYTSDFQTIYIDPDFPTSTSVTLAEGESIVVFVGAWSEVADTINFAISFAE